MMRLSSGLLLMSLCLLSSCSTDVLPPDRSGQVRAPWVLDAATGNELTLRVMTAGPDCQRFAGIDVTESGESVELRAWVEDFGAESCFAAQAYHPTTVTLRDPLGARALVGCLIEDSGPHDSRETCAEVVDS